MQRRQFLASTLAAGLLKAATDQPRTLVYKRAAGCDIKADVFGDTGGGKLSAGQSRQSCYTHRK